jgi:hypothetical protein
MLNCLQVGLCFPFTFRNIDGIAAIDEEVDGDGDCFRCREKIGAVTNGIGDGREFSNIVAFKCSQNGNLET